MDKSMSDNTLECKLCGKVVMNMSGLGLHIRVHDISTEKYFIEILGNSHGSCIECGKGTTFVSLGLGFSKFCSWSCGTKHHWKHGDNTERCRKIVAANKISQLGKVNSKESNEKRSKTLKGRTYVDLFGVEGAKAQSKKRSIAHSGPKNSQWKGGHSVDPYPHEFVYLRPKIKARDGHVCQLCSRTEVEEKKELSRGLAVHHIDYNKENNIEENLITLCCRCNSKVNASCDMWKRFFEVELSVDEEGAKSA